jgi:hypothetical protein
VQVAGGSSRLVLHGAQRQLKAVLSACVVAIAIAFDAVSGRARLNSSIGLPAISARRAAIGRCVSAATVARNASRWSSCIIGNLRIRAMSTVQATFGSPLTRRGALGRLEGGAQ